MSCYYTREEWYSNITERHRNITEVWYYPIGRHYSVDARHKNVIEVRYYATGRHYIIEEQHENVIEVRYYAIGRYCTIEGQYYGFLQKAKKLTVEGGFQTRPSQIKLIAGIILSVGITL